MDDLGLVQAVDRFGERVVVGVADASDRRLDTGLDQALGVFDRDVLHAAIGMVDEAAAKLRTEIDSVPSELDAIRRRILQLQIEQASLKQEKDAASRERLGKVEKELANLTEQDKVLTAQCFQAFWG